MADGTYHLKILVPSVVAGAIIGKGGETIAQLQKDVGARVKMSKATDFYPGTTERVCLITGNVESITRIHEFIMEKVKEKPDPNAKMAIDFDHKQPAEREKQVKILVPNSTAGMIIGKGGSFIKQIKEESGAYVQISQKSKDHALAERCITVIGEMENNKNACQMILSKIVEDPQSGSCLNISYADVTGPIANFNPTGSPFANPGSVTSGAMNSNASYSSDGSLNSLSPNVTNSFQDSKSGTAQPGMFPFAGIGITPHTVPPSHVAHVIEYVKNMLRGNGYSEQALAEICAAMTTLSNYGLLSLGLSILNGINGSSFVGNVGVGIPNPVAANCTMAAPRIPNQDMYNTATGVQKIHTGPNSIANTASMGTGSSLFGPIGSFGNGISGLGLGPTFTSTTVSQTPDRFLIPAEPTMFEPFRTSPTLASPSAAALPINNNSFGLGTGFNSGASSLRKSPSPNDGQIGDVSKIEIEVGENIVGAILGPGGKSLVEIQRFSGANIQISKKGIFAPGTRNRIVAISGQPNAVVTAQYLIQRQISEEEAKRAQQNAMGVLR
ncbi:hypothetical protein JTE90_004971 [Oedothorax gibbosus]|uniref:K Homology domain-containing protein n=1 Tax=Oedothorax gibbosus TaxID=931172 RepID=A0AAV6VHZ4_9ARAC|nr:hypothetical protein JTE90_004971 [Oedothorax gibbosus]